eukprot:CAMPEP_0185906104 /NCGR_PEP_ID=MMETSP0196C-20130402/5240_1 /TAXON_ID=2932 /ORGANISM="Alexandrium fundyense, Strain CCMP1719" /LENGTH=46 /DNA_ID= /DNA_START= /DNA_END= /DNA_ORIENTATION=
MESRPSSLNGISHQLKAEVMHLMAHRHQGPRNWEGRINVARCHWKD